MLEVADIFRLHGPGYRAQFGKQLLPSHRRAMQDIETCRTAALGGQLYYCTQCDEQRYSYHSCKNRHCPKCRNEQANDWLAAQQSLLLPVTHFLVTFTLPAALRPLARSNQKTIYNLLFRASSQALLQLAQDPRFVGARLGLVGVLHTWTRQLLYHPHVHYIVTGGGLTADGRWRSARKDFLVPVKALSPIFRARFREELKKSELFAQVEQRVWQQDWVVHSEPVGSGAQAFQYLAPYIFRVALSNNRLRQLQQGNVTFSYKESATAQLKHCTVSAHEFIRRFLQHVLPPRFIKVRYYGLLSPPAATTTESPTTARSSQQTKECYPKATPAADAVNLSALPSATHVAWPTRSQRSRPMKRPLPLCASYFSWTTAANYSRRTAPLCQKPLKNQPHWLVSSTSNLNLSRLTSFSLPALPLSRQSHSFSSLFKLQVPSNPA